jgi:tetratricopeptide (TPR) repeat protein
MIRKRQTSWFTVHFAVIIFSFFVAVTTEAQPEQLVRTVETTATLPSEAAGKHDALLQLLFVDKSKTLEPWSGSCGFFIDEEGRALCDLGAFSRQRKPDRIESVSGEALEFPRILATFPKQDLILVQFEYRPAVHIELDPDGAAMGDLVAVLDIALTEPAAVGPILARVAMTSVNHRQRTFQERLSIGAGLSSSLRRPPSTGAPVISLGGAAIGAFSGVRPKRRQLMLYCTPLSDLASPVEIAIAADRDILFPLSESLVSVDRASLSYEYAAGVAAFSRGDYVRTRGYVEALKQSFPDSYMVKEWEFDLANMSGEHTKLLEVAKLLRPPPAAGPAWVACYYTKVGQAHAKSGNLTESIAAFKASVAVSPTNHPVDREMLASVLRAAGQIEEAEHWYRQAAAASPDSILALRGLRAVLDRRRKYEEAIRLTDQIWSLERTYSRP